MGRRYWRPNRAELLPNKCIDRVRTVQTAGVTDKANRPGRHLRPDLERVLHAARTLDFHGRATVWGSTASPPESDPAKTALPRDPSRSGHRKKGNCRRNGDGC